MTYHGNYNIETWRPQECCPPHGSVLDYLQGNMNRKYYDSLLKHLVDCDKCASQITEYEALDKKLREENPEGNGLLPDLGDSPENLSAKVKKMIEELPNPPWMKPPEI